MKNEVQSPADRLVMAAPYARSSGEGALVGSIFGVALSDVANGASGAFALTGIFDVTKLATDVVAVGDPLYWDDTNKRLTVTASTHKRVGVATKAQINGDTTARIRLGYAA